MPVQDAHIERLTTLLATVRLRLEPDGDAWVVHYEKEAHPLRALPLDDLDPAAEAGEIMAVAAAFTAAIKHPGDPAPAGGLREDAATVLPKVERARFVTAYHAITDARGDGPGAHLFHRPFGGEFVVTYVHDGGWRFSYIVAARVAAWNTTVDTVHSVARSNLYHKQELDFRARVLSHSDGYDAARAVILDDVFYDRAGPAGIPVAIPGRDALFIGPDIDPAAVREAYETAAYPISPRVHAFRGHSLDDPDHPDPRRAPEQPR